MKTKILLLTVSVMLLLTSCESHLKMPKEVAFLDITDAYYIGTDENISNNHEDGGVNNLVKITTESLDSDPVPVDFLDGSGEPLDSDFVYAYADPPILLSERYSVLWGEFKFTTNEGQSHSNGLLVDNETGAVYDLGYEYQPTCFNGYLGSKYHQVDKQGNIYFFTGGVKRLIFQDINNVIIEQYMDFLGSLADWEMTGYFVDPYANIYFSNGQRLKLSTGGIVETGIERMACFSGFRGDVFGLETCFSIGEVRGTNLIKLLPGIQSFEKELLLSTEYAFENQYNTFCYSPAVLWYYPIAQKEVHIFLSNHIVRYDTWIPKTIGIVFNETDQTIYNVLLPDKIPDEITILGLESSYLWVQDEYIFYSIDLNSYTENENNTSLTLNTFQKFEIPGNVELQFVRFNEERIIEFEAYDLANEKQVIGYISMDAGLEYFEVDSKLGSVRLTRIR